MDWHATAADKVHRYVDGETRIDDERSLVRQGNVAYAAGLAYLMEGDPSAGEWLRRAAADWRASWDLGEGRESWGRPIGALKASLLAGDEAAVEDLAHWTLDLGTATAESPIGRYAAVLALLALGRWPEGRHVAVSLRERNDFPHDVADALAAISAHDVVATIEAVEAVAASFERRDAYLEDMAVADTALVLQLLARRREIEVELPRSAVLPA
jgi:hypothetical protein